MFTYAMLWSEEKFFLQNFYSNLKMVANMLKVSVIKVRAFSFYHVGVSAWKYSNFKCLVFTGFNYLTFYLFWLKWNQLAVKLHM